MSQTKDEAYANARMALNSAMTDFIEAALEIGKLESSIASDISDSAFDASDQTILLA